MSEHLRERIEPLLNEYEVDLVLSGHVHAYSRTCNALDGRCMDSDEGGMVHITVRWGGFHRPCIFVCREGKQGAFHERYEAAWCMRAWAPGEGPFPFVSTCFLPIGQVEPAGWPMACHE